MSTLEIRNPLELRKLSEDHKLNRVLQSALKGRWVAPAAGPAAPYWGADYFGLSTASLFKDATGEEKRSILALCSRSLLEEAFFIEKSGMTFTAKMALLSESAQERMLYSLFSADEATHLAMVESHLPGKPPAPEGQPFLHLLSDMIQNGDQRSLVFLIQVVLEGWGITHYHGLAEACEDQGLKGCIRQILKDEAKHHGSGMILFKESELASREESYIHETMVRFLEMIQAGPQRVASAAEKVKGHLSREQRIRLFEELDCERQTQRKLDELRSVMMDAGAARIVEKLEAQSCFNPWSAQSCASASAS